MTNQTQNPTGTPGLEKLENITNTTIEAGRVAKKDFDNAVTVYPDGAANIAMLFAFVIVMAFSLKNGWGGRLAPGGRGNPFHTVLAGGINLMLALAGAVVANDVVLGAYGVQTPSLTKPRVMSVDRDLYRQPPEPPVARTPEVRGEPVNPNRNARVIKLDPNP